MRRLPKAPQLLLLKREHSKYPFSHTLSLTQVHTHIQAVTSSLNLSQSFSDTDSISLKHSPSHSLTLSHALLQLNTLALSQSLTHSLLSHIL